jgi:glycerol-3-phosphate dehydrogenase subunit B
MKFDTIIIGGGLSSLVCGIRLQEAGKQCLIISAGQNALHFSSGTFGLLGRMPDGTAVADPLSCIAKLPAEHPYSKIGADKVREYADGVIPFFGKYGIVLKGFDGVNGWRFTPMGTFKPAWLALEEVPFFKSPNEAPFANSADEDAVYGASKGPAAKESSDRTDAKSSDGSASRKSYKGAAELESPGGADSINLSVEDYSHKTPDGVAALESSDATDSFNSSVEGDSHKMSLGATSLKSSDRTYSLKSSGEAIWRKALIVNFAGFMDFNSVFIAEGLERKGLRCRTEVVKLKDVERLRTNPTEMRSINIARVMEREDCWKEFGRTVHSLLKDEDVVVVPEVFGLNDTKICSWVSEMIKAPVMFVGTMPPSVAGVRTQKLLKKAFENIGGTFLMGDEALCSSISNGRVLNVKTRNLGDTLLEADNFVLASGHLFAHGLVASPDKVEEPVFEADVEYPADRNAWYNRNFFEKQNYLGFGVLTDDSFKAFKDGSVVDNLYVIGSEVGGCNSLNEESGAGVAIMTAFRVADEIIGE